MIAEIIVNSNARALNRIFDYIIPVELENKIHIGSRVSIPFGKSGKLDDGFVINIKETSEFAVKNIVSSNENESLQEKNVVLAKLMARKYFCNISDCIKLMLPPGTAQKDEAKRMKEKQRRFVFLNKNKDEIDFLIESKKLKSEKHIKVAEFLLENDGILSTDLEDILDVSSAILKTMEKNEIIHFEEHKIDRNPFFNKNIINDEKRNLTDEQKKCFNAISKDIDDEIYSKNLIFGVTGSRKNRNIFATYRKSFGKTEKVQLFWYQKFLLRLK